MADFDVILIGAGPGGYVAAIRAAQLGLKTAVVEKGPKPEWGGTCLHWGCIPTKALLHDAYLFEQIKRAEKFGVDVPAPKLNLDNVMKHKELVVKRGLMGVEALLKKNKVTTFVGFGKVVKPGVVDVDGKQHTTRNIVLATGSAVKWFPGMEPDGKGIITSNEAIGLGEVPRSLVVLGSGAVGVEFASIFRRFGSRVTLVELLPRLVPNEDEAISAELAKSFRKQGITIHTGTKVTRATAGGAGVEIEAQLPDGTVEKMSADYLLVATGRGPVLDFGQDRAGEGPCRDIPSGTRSSTRRARSTRSAASSSRS